MHARDQELSHFLLSTGMVPRAVLAEAEAEARSSGESFTGRLVRLGALSEDEVRRALAKVLGIPFVTFAQPIAAQALACIPESFSRAHGVVAYNFRPGEGGGAGVLEVAMLDIEAHERLQELALPHVIQVRFTDRASLTRALLQYQKLLKEMFSGYAQAAPLDAILERALYSLAEAVELTPAAEGYLARYRIRGMFYEALMLPPGVGEAAIARVRELSRAAASSAHAGGGFKVLAGSEEVLVRVSSLPTTEGEVITLHLTRGGKGPLGYELESLGFHGEGLQELRHALVRNPGLVLVCGGQHSGRTTLLYTLLGAVGGHTRTTITVEERVAAALPFAAQTEVSKGGMSLPAGVRAALAHNPEVLMISSLASREVALLALEAANRGITVVAGIDAPSASEGIAALLDFDLSPRLVAAVLSVAVSTRLARRLCPSCQLGARTYQLTRTQTASLEEVVSCTKVLATLKEEKLVSADALWRDVSFAEPHGCSSCTEGCAGYIGVQEVLPRRKTIQAAIEAGSSATEVARAAREAGMLTRLEDGVYKAAQKLTSLQEVLLPEA